MTGTESETGIGSGIGTGIGTGIGIGSEALKRLHGAWSGGGDAPAPLCPPLMRGADEQTNGMQGTWFYVLCSMYLLTFILPGMNCLKSNYLFFKQGLETLVFRSKHS